jgi:hypothetical protein
MKKALFLIFIGNIFTYSLFAQDMPFLGYDRVPWGATTEDVIRAYSMGDEVRIRQNTADKTEIMQENVSDNIRVRYFFFNGNKLYRVWVYYRNTDLITFNNLNLALSQRYGTPTESFNDTGIFATGETYTITQFNYGRFSPEILVELSRSIYSDSDDSIGVCYIWKRFEDEYNISRIEL